MTQKDLYPMKQTERLLDMAAYLSIKRTVSADELSIRYHIGRATVFRDKNCLYDYLGVIFDHEPGQCIRVSDNWHFKFVPLFRYQRWALLRAIELIDDKDIKAGLISIL